MASGDKIICIQDVAALLVTVRDFASDPDTSFKNQDRRAESVLLERRLTWTPDTGKTAFYVQRLAQSYYMLQNDGVTGQQDSDIFVQLAGVTDLTDVNLGDILVA